MLCPSLLYTIEPWIWSGQRKKSYAICLSPTTQPNPYLVPTSENSGPVQLLLSRNELRPRPKAGPNAPEISEMSYRREPTQWRLYQQRRSVGFISNPTSNSQATLSWCLLPTFSSQPSDPQFRITHSFAFAAVTPTQSTLLLGALDDAVAPDFLGQPMTAVSNPCRRR